MLMRKSILCRPCFKSADDRSLFTDTNSMYNEIIAQKHSVSEAVCQSTTSLITNNAEM